MFPLVGHSLNQGSDLSMSGQAHETYPRCPAEERRVRGQPWFCCPQEGGGQGGVLQSGRQLVCVSQWQLEQSTTPPPPPAQSVPTTPHHSVMPRWWVNIEPWTLNEKGTHLSLQTSFCFFWNCSGWNVCKCVDRNMKMSGTISLILVVEVMILLKRVFQEFFRSYL